MPRQGEGRRDQLKKKKTNQKRGTKNKRYHATLKDAARAYEFITKVPYKLTNPYAKPKGLSIYDRGIDKTSRRFFIGTILEINKRLK